MNKTLKKLEELQSYWTDIPKVSIESQIEIIYPTAIKCFSTYSLSYEITKHKDYGSLEHTCDCSNTCDSQIKEHINKVKNNNDDLFKKRFNEDVNNRQPLLKDNWEVMNKVESYVEECHTCNAIGHVDCTTCDTYGTPTGKVSCGSCWGNGKKSCGSCSGSGKSNDKTCFSCMGSGKKTCFSCSGSGKVTCRSCDGSLVVICASCKGHKHFTYYETARFSVVSNAEISWEQSENKDWVNDYIENEINDKPTHIDLMNTSEWHFHTLNVSSLDKFPYSASIQGQLTTITSKVVQNDKVFDCFFIGETLEAYKLNYIFDDYLFEKSKNANKNNLAEHISFFNNKVVENIVDKKGDGIPVKSQMIRLETRTKIQNTFDKIANVYKNEQDDIDVKDISVWTAAFTLFFSFFIIAFGLFTQNQLDLTHFGFTNVFLNIETTLSFISRTDPIYFSIGIVSIIPITFIMKRFLASSKESILRFSAWYLVLVFFIVSLTYLLLYPNNFFNGVEWGLNLDYLTYSFNNLKTVFIDVLLLSGLMGILKARRINCLKVRGLSDSLKNDTLKKILGYDK